MMLRPVQRPDPPVWFAANNDAAVARAARLGDVWVINPHAKLAVLERQMGVYRHALRDAGRPFPAELPIINLAPDRAPGARRDRRGTDTNARCSPPPDREALA